MTPDARRRPHPDADCPCGGGRFGSCCERFLDGVEPATAEELMRSRYTAFALADGTHLWRTWHPRTRPEDVGIADGSRWRGLRIIEVVDGGPGDDRGVVEFEARYTDGDGEGILRERSRFGRRAGRWRYIDGDFR